MDTLQTLRSARALISERWSRDGSEVGKYCIAQALVKFTGEYEVQKTAAELFAKANGIDMPTSNWSPLFNFNDKHTHEEVLAAFDKAIEYASSN
jgi:hypothetical protein